MPHFTPDTPTFTRKFSDILITVPAPFANGDALSANEANFLNGQIASVVGNAYSGEIRRTEAAKPGSTKDWDHQAKFNEKYEEYVLGVSNRGGDGVSASSPLERMISTIAAEDLKARIAAKGLKVSAFYKAKSADGTQSRWAELLAKNVEENHDKFAAQAQAIIDNIATDTDDLDFSLPEAPVGEDTQAAA